ncbi:Uridine phosphorylase 1 [Papilio xuthus]|uniref:Uridine phosphorylase 1 n=1 Tax=Papilio xuthus TaxID=66420 RepID=A0A194PIH8_PAPXU|nr:Uridine phosphorylase 1 [Papilio xuthus]
MRMLDGRNMPCNSEDDNGVPIHQNGCRLTADRSAFQYEHRHQIQENGNSMSEEVDPDLVRYPDGTVRLRNPNIELMDQDILYHLALGSGSHDLVEMFGDVQIGQTHIPPVWLRAPRQAHMLVPALTRVRRHAMVRRSVVGQDLSLLHHGMGIPSVGILLHEVIKLMYHAKVRDPVFFRIGTCGGIGYEGGTVVISEEAVDGTLKNALELTVLGKTIQRLAKLDRRLVKELKSLADPEDPYDTITGKTMCTYDFYEGQGRLDGAFCDFTEADKMEYLESIHKAGVVNIEMESLAFAALTHHAGIKAAVVCVTFLDRLKGDQVLAPKEVLDEWQERPTKLVCRYIKKHLQMKGRLSLEGHGSIAVKSPRRFKLVQQESENYD